MTDPAAITSAVQQLAVAMSGIGTRKLLNAREAAAWLGFSNKQARKLMARISGLESGPKPVRLGGVNRWKLSDLERFADSLTNEDKADRSLSIPRIPRNSSRRIA